jgi:hypothetical protein
MSQIIGDALFAGGAPVETHVATTETSLCDNWATAWAVGGDLPRTQRALRCKMSGRLRPTHAKCEPTEAT